MLLHAATDELAFDFSVPIGLAKALPRAADTDDWIVSAPVGLMDEPDHDRQIVTKKAVIAGLRFHKLFGGHVDWDHQYLQTGDLSKIIGVALNYPLDGEGTPWANMKLFKSPEKPLAKAAWDHLHSDPDAYLGVSMEGVAKKPKATRGGFPLVDDGLEIRLLTLSPLVKGYTRPRVRIGPYQGESMLELSKGVASDDSRLWVPRGEVEQRFAVLKAMTVGDGVVGADTTGGAATRLESIHPNRRGEAQCLCPACKSKNRTSRKHCRRCGKALGA